MLVNTAAADIGGTPLPGITKTNARWGSSLRSNTGQVSAVSVRRGQMFARQSQITDAWINQLTTAQRVDWTTYATNNPSFKDSGRQVTLNGFQMFTRLNQTRLHIGLPIAKSSPINIPSMNFTQPEITLTQSNTIILLWLSGKPWMNSTKYYLMVYVAGPRSITRFTRPPRMRLGGIVQGGSLPIPARIALIANPWPGTIGSVPYLRFRLTYDWT